MTSRSSYEPGRRHLGPVPASVGGRGKKRPAVVVQADTYAGTVSTLVVAEVTSNLTMAGNPTCLVIDVSEPEGQATGLIHKSVVSCLLLATVDANRVAKVLGKLSPTMKQKLDGCLKSALSSPENCSSIAACCRQRSASLRTARRMVNRCGD